MIFAALLFALAVSVGIIALWRIFGPEGVLKKRSALHQRVFRSFASSGHEGVPNLERHQHISDLPSVDHFLRDRRIFEKLALLLRRARWKISVLAFLLSSLLSAVVIFLILQRMFQPWLCLVGALALGSVPLLLLRYQNHRYLRRFSEHLSNALSVMSNAIRSGHGLADAIRSAVHAAPYPVSTEFETILAETRLGSSFPRAFRNLYRRISTPEVKILTVGIAIHEEMGGNLTELLDNLEKTIRGRFALEREIKVLSAQGRLTAKILTGLPFFLVLIWLRGDKAMFLDFMASSGGRFTIMAAAFALVIGFSWIHRIVQMKD